MRFLLDEEIGIGDMERILSALSQCPPDIRYEPALMAEHVRHALNQQITAKLTRGGNSLNVLRLAPEIEKLMLDAILTTRAGDYLDLDSRSTQQLSAAIRNQVDTLESGEDDMVIMTVWKIRRFVRRLVELEFPWLQVVSQQDLEPNTQIREVACISLEQTSHCHTPSVQETST